MPLDGGMSNGSGDADQALSVRTQKAALPLYVSRIKVYPKAVSGDFRRIKWAVLSFCLTVYYLTPWLRYDRGPGAPDQAVLLDLAGARAYFFSVEIWPQEIYFLAGAMIFGAVALFLVSSLFGRLWCGYACPQTVWTDLFIWVERLIEGDRNARMRLDRAPWSPGKAARKALKHGAWLTISLATGGAWIFYYADAPTTARAVFTGAASTEIYFFIGLFTTTTYVLAGWAREQVCTYMCPWPRFQAAMFDEHTLTVTYQAWRGEPRGAHKAGQSWDGRGDCIDCRQCVAACPTGIDIRDGQQLECIGCGLCIDACDEIMDKVGRPQGLIAFSTFTQQAARASGAHAATRLVRPRTFLYAALLSAISAVMAVVFFLRSDLEFGVIRDRAPLYVVLSDGSIRNGYTLKIVNKARAVRSFMLSMDGPAGAAMSVAAADGAADGDVLSLQPGAVTSYRVYVAAPRANLASDSTPLTFKLSETAGSGRADHRSVFMAPERK